MFFSENIRLEKAGLKLVMARMTHLSPEQADGFHAVHKVDHFNLMRRKTRSFMTPGPVMISVFEDEINKNREVVEATNPKEAASGTIRADFASSIDANAVHDSDCPETVKEEISFFFKESEIFS